jgi:peroxiredoxin
MQGMGWSWIAAAALCLPAAQTSAGAGGAPAAAEQAEVDEQAREREAQRRREAERRLLEVGATAADFTLPLADGGSVTLGSFFTTSKAILVVFSGIGKEQGGPNLPKLQKLHDQFSSKGLTTIVINPVDETSDVRRFIMREKLQLLVAVDGKETNRAVTGVYRARQMPVYYLLDPESKVLWRAAGWDETELRAALAKRGVE